MSKNKILTIAKYTCLTLFVIMTVTIWIFSLTPGNVSAEQSSALSKVVSELFPSRKVVAIDSLSITSVTESYYIGDTVKLNVSYTPQNASSPLLIWDSEDKNIIELSNNGEVTFIEAGSATVIAIYADNQEIFDEIVLICIGTPPPALDETVTAINIISETDIPLNYYVSLAAVCADTFLSIKPHWSVDNTSVAKILKNKVIGISEGSTILTAKYGEIQASVTITVLSDSSVGNATAIEIGADSNTMSVFNSLQLNAATLPLSEPGNKILQQFIWQSNNTEILTVKGGLVYAKAPGTARVFVSWLIDDTVFDYFDITVIAPLPEGLSLNAPKISKGQKKMIAAQFEGDPYDKRIAYSSDNESVLTINQNGLITAKSNGTATITAISLADESISAEITITVKPSAMFSLYVRKIIGHFGLFFILAIFGTMAFFLLFNNKWLGILITILCGIVASSVAEILQLPVFTTGRYASIADVGINFLGFVCGAAITLGCIFAVIKIRKTRQEKAIIHQKD